MLYDSSSAGSYDAPSINQSSFDLFSGKGRITPVTSYDARQNSHIAFASAYEMSLSHPTYCFHKGFSFASLSVINGNVDADATLLIAKVASYVSPPLREYFISNSLKTEVWSVLFISDMVSLNIFTESLCSSEPSLSLSIHDENANFPSLLVKA